MYEKGWVLFMPCLSIILQGSAVHAQIGGSIAIPSATSPKLSSVNAPKAIYSYLSTSTKCYATPTETLLVTATAISGNGGSYSAWYPSISLIAGIGGGLVALGGSVAAHFLLRRNTKEGLDAKIAPDHDWTGGGGSSIPKVEPFIEVVLVQPPPLPGNSSMFKISALAQMSIQESAVILSESVSSEHESNPISSVTPDKADRLAKHDQVSARLPSSKSSTQQKIAQGSKQLTPTNGSSPASLTMQSQVHALEDKSANSVQITRSSRAHTPRGVSREGDDLLLKYAIDKIGHKSSTTSIPIVAKAGDPILSHGTSVVGSIDAFPDDVSKPDEEGGDQWVEGDGTEIRSGLTSELDGRKKRQVYPGMGGRDKTKFEARPVHLASDLDVQDLDVD